MLEASERKKLLRNLPETPGVYIYRSASGRVVYVGKAINVKRRVSSYFALKKTLGIKTQALVDEITFIEIIKVESEIEALLLEARLIKQYRPQYNVQWTDDKDYLYIKITWKEPIPKVLMARRERLPGNIYIGPFPSAGIVKFTLRTLRRIFPYCNEKATQMRKDGTNLYTDLGLCPGPHAGFMTPKEYKQHIRRFTLFLEGKKNVVISQLEKEIKRASKEMRYEQAAKLKRQIDGIHYITSQITHPEEYLENPELFADRREEELEELHTVLQLPTIPHRIECYDISTIQGRFAVGSMVVFTDGEADKREYRKFRIRYTQIPKDIPNDMWMMREVLSRRLKNNWPNPDLLLIDGGKPQVSAVAAVLRDLRVAIPIAGLAKRYEELYRPGKPDPIRLPKESRALHLVQRLRDEAHRFAITYHRKLRNKETFAS